MPEHMYWMLFAGSVGFSIGVGWCWCIHRKAITIHIKAHVKTAQMLNVQTDKIVELRETQEMLSQNYRGLQLNYEALCNKQIEEAEAEAEVQNNHA